MHVVAVGVHPSIQYVVLFCIQYKGSMSEKKRKETCHVNQRISEILLLYSENTNATFHALKKGICLPKDDISSFSLHHHPTI